MDVVRLNTLHERLIVFCLSALQTLDTSSSVEGCLILYAAPSKGARIIRPTIWKLRNLYVK